MAISSRSALLVAANQIRNEVADRANTAIRVGDEFISVIDSMALVIDATAMGAVSGGAAAANTTAIAAAVARAISVNGEVYLPEGTFLTNATIPDLHAVRWTGSGVIQRGSDLFYVDPKPGQTNRLYVATTGNDANDGLSSSQPRASIQGAFDAMGNYGPMLGGNWRVEVAAGTYTNQPVEVQGLQSADYIVIAGPSVAMGVTPTALHDGTGATELFGMQFTHNMIVKVENIKIQNWTSVGASALLAQHRTQLWTYNVHVDNCDDGGIYAQGACRLYVQGGDMANCAKGIRAIHECDFTIGQGGDGPTVHDCDYGLHLRNQSSGIVVNTTVQDCTSYGVQLFHFAEARFTNCTISGNGIGMSVIRSDWFLDAGTTVTGSTTRDFESSQFSGELVSEMYEYHYNRTTGRHGWGGGPDYFAPSAKYHFRYDEVSGGNFNAAVRMGLEATTPVFGFLADSGTPTNFGGFYFGTAAASSIGQFVYRYDDNSFRVVQNNATTYRFETTGFRPNADNTQDLGLVGSRWNQIFGTQLHFGAGGTFLTSGSGTPEGTVTAPIGSLYTDTANGDLYRKTSGAGNTGWVTP